MAVVAGVAMAATACSSPESTYFATSGTTVVSVPTDVPTSTYFGIEILMANDGDVVELRSVTPRGLRGDATVEGVASVLNGERTWIGAATGAGVIAAGIDLGAYRPVAGLAFATSDGPVALAVRVTGTEPVVGFDALTLQFTVDGGPPLRQTFPVYVRVCRAETLMKAADLCHQELEAT